MRDLITIKKYQGLCVRNRRMFLAAVLFPLKIKQFLIDMGSPKLLLVVVYSLYESADALQKRHTVLPPADPHQHWKCVLSVACFSITPIIIWKMWITGLLILSSAADFSLHLLSDIFSNGDEHGHMLHVR